MTRKLESAWLRRLSEDDLTTRRKNVLGPLKHCKQSDFVSRAVFRGLEDSLETVSDGLTREARVLRIRQVVLAHFTEQHWRNMASAVGCSEVLAQHEESLGAITWGDDAYAANILNLLTRMLDLNPDGLALLEDCVSECLKTVRPGSFAVVTLAKV